MKYSFHISKFGTNCAIFSLLSFVFFVTAGAEFLIGSTEAQDRKYEDLFQRVKLALKSQGAVPVSIGSTVLEQNAVRGALRFTDVIYVDVKGDPQISVYIAYWAANVISPREVGFHTPDHCWVNAGWRRIDTADEGMFAELRQFQQPKSRKFLAGSTEAYVLYWHIYGDRCIDYGSGAFPDYASWITDIRRFGLSQKLPQMFIRIHCSKSFVGLGNDRTVQLIGRLVSNLTN